MTVLTDLKQRGVEDVLITCVDGLSGFDTAIANRSAGAVFPAATVQLCIVHQLRNSFRFIPDKYLKDFVADIKTVYQAPTAEQGWEKLLVVEQAWGIAIRRLCSHGSANGPCYPLILTTQRRCGR